MSTSAPQLLHHFRGPADTVTHVAFHPTQSRLASASADHSVQLWTFLPRLRCYRLTAHTAPVHAVAWSSDGEVLASASSDRTARLWIPTVRGRSGELRGHTGAVRHVDFNPSGRKLCTASDDKTVKYWSVVQKRYICTYSGHTNWVRCAKIAADGQQIASCSDDRTLRLWDVRSGKTVHVHSETKGGTGTQLAWHPDDHCIAVALTNRRVKVYDARTRKLLQLYEFAGLDDEADGHPMAVAVTSLSWHPSGKYMVAGSRTGETRVLDLMEGRPIYTMLGHESSVETCAFAPEGNRLASGGVDRQIMIWSFTAKDTTYDDAENRAASLNVSGVESLASTVGDDERGAGGQPADTSVMLNPRNLLHDYQDDEFEIEIKTGNALPVEYLNVCAEEESAHSRFNVDLDALFEQIAEVRAQVDAIWRNVRRLEMGVSVVDDTDIAGVFD